MKNAFLLAALLACSFSSLAASGSPGKKPYVIAYVFGSRIIDPAQIDARDLTHINYAFADIVQNEVVPTSANRFDSLNIPALMGLKQQNPDLKILISIGGWGASGGFSDAALTAESRETFSRSAIRYMQRWGFDGIDLDWEYPGQPGAGNTHRPEDKENFTLMLQDLRERLNALSASEGREHPYLLTIAAGAGQRYLDFTEMDKAQRYLDFVNIMTYDFMGGWDPMAGHHTNLYPSKMGQGSRIDVATSVDLMLKAGVPANKLLIGAAFYGRSWTLQGTDGQGVNQPAASGYREFRYHAIRDSLITQAGYVRYWDKKAKAPYLFHPQLMHFVSYEDTQSIREKMRYVRRKKLLGIMFWEYFGDNRQELVKTMSGIKARK